MMSTGELIKVKSHFHIRHDWQAADTFERDNATSSHRVSIEFDPIDAVINLLMEIVHEIIAEETRKQPCAEWLITIIFKDTNNVFINAKEIHVYVLESLQVVINIYQTA